MSHILNLPKPRRMNKKRIQQQIEDYRYKQKAELELAMLKSAFDDWRDIAKMHTQMPPPRRSWWQRFKDWENW